MFRFENPEYFWLLLTVPILVFILLRFLKWSKVRASYLGRSAIREQLTSGKIPGRMTTKFLLMLSAIITAIIGLANLQAGDQSAVQQSKGVDVVFALDVSKSMLARDISPDRLTRAKLLIKTMLDKMSEDRAGLVLFAGRAYLQSPLTTDRGTVNMLLNAATVDAAPTQGTVIADAIRSSTEAFNSKEKKYKALILISDGEDHDQAAAGLAEEAAQKGVILHTVGIGSPQGATIYDPGTGGNKVDASGRTVITKLNEQALKDLALAGKGSYHYLSNNNTTADALLGEISKMERRNVGTRTFLHYKSYYQYFLLVSLLLLCINALLPVATAPKTISSF